MMEHAYCVRIVAGVQFRSLLNSEGRWPRCADSPSPTSRRAQIQRATTAGDRVEMFNFTKCSAELSSISTRPAGDLAAFGIEYRYKRTADGLSICCTCFELANKYVMLHSNC
jgi:hypothetical protein